MTTPENDSGLCPHGRGPRAPCGDCTEDKYGHNDPWPQPEESDSSPVSARTSRRNEGWWLCPNEPRCPHGAILHDVYDYEDTSPTCCVDGCDCGREKR